MGLREPRARDGYTRAPKGKTREKSVAGARVEAAGRRSGSNVQGARGEGEKARIRQGRGRRRGTEIDALAVMTRGAAAKAGETE